MTTPKKPPAKASGPQPIDFAERQRQAEVARADLKKRQAAETASAKKATAKVAPAALPANFLVAPSKAAAKATIPIPATAKPTTGQAPVDKTPAADPNKPQLPETPPMSAETIENILAGVRDLSTYQENVMHQFDNTAYHARLYQTVDRDVSKRFYPDFQAPASDTEYYNRLDEFQQVVIAETGSTSYNIQNFTIESLVAPGMHSVCFGTNSIVMTILEPGGVTFLDSMKNAAIQLRTRDIRRCWFYLELTFKGYLDGEIKTNLLSDEGFSNGGKWIWRVQITDINTKLSSGGGEYKLSMIPYNETSYEEDARLVPDQIIVEGDTINDFFQSLKKSLDNSWKLRVGQKNYRQYFFKFHDTKGRVEITGDMLEKFTLRPTYEGQAYIRHADLVAQAIDAGQPIPEEKEPEVKPTQTKDKAEVPPTLSVSPFSNLARGQFPRGTSIDEIVVAAFQCSPEAIALAKDAPKADPNSADDELPTDTGPGKVNDNGFREAIIWRIEPEIEVLTYDPIFNDYGKRITYHIYGYVTQGPILTKTQILQANDIEVQKRMVATLAKQGLLKKKYDYLYTGLNTDVLDLDLSFDLLWTAALPRLVKSEALRAQSTYDIDAITKYSEAIDVVQHAGDIQADQQAAIEDFNAALESGNADAITKAKENVDAKTTEADAAVEKITRLREQLYKLLPKFDEKAAFNAKKQYAEDLDVGSLPQFADLSIAMKYGQEEARQSVAGGMISQTNNGSSIFGAVMNQLEGQMTSQMIMITMKITGDPYWIGPANMETVPMRRLNTSPVNTADYTVGDNVFTLSFAYPQGYKEDGSPILKRNDMFTGLYRVNKVTHEFSDGKFTQTLSANRMPLIDLFKATSNTEAPK